MNFFYPPAFSPKMQEDEWTKCVKYVRFEALDDF